MRCFFAPFLFFHPLSAAASMSTIDTVDSANACFFALVLRPALCRMPHAYATPHPGTTGEEGREGGNTNDKENRSGANEEMEQVMEKWKRMAQVEMALRGGCMEVKKRLRWREQTFD